MIKAKFSCKRGELTIRGRVFRPEGNGLPIAILSHGFMANQSMMKDYAAAAAEAGYAAFTYDFCGGCIQGKSDGKTTDMSVLTEVEDVKAVISYASSLPYTDESKLVLIGASQGGFVSALAAAEMGDQIDRLVLLYPALCIPDDARKGQMMFAKFDPHDIPPVINCGPMKLGSVYAEAVMDMDPFAAISPYRNPVLIIHGSDDRIVNPDYAKRAESSYPDAQLEIIQGAGHGFKRKDNQKAIPLMVEFLK